MKEKNEKDNVEMVEPEDTPNYEEIDTPDFSLTYLANKLGPGVVKNAEFIEKNFPEVLSLLDDIKNEILQDGLIECGETLCTMIFDIGFSRFLSLIHDLISGNMPGGYASMRTILEGVVDSVIAYTRFSDYPFPEDLEMLRQLEREQNVNFRKKCSLLLPKEINKQTRDKIYQLYDNLSRSWVHPKGIAKMLKEKHGPPPGWTMILPNPYNDDDKTELSEFFQKLRELGEYIHELLQSAIKLSAK